MPGEEAVRPHDVVSRARLRLRVLTAPDSGRGKGVALTSLLTLTVLIVVLNGLAGASAVPVLSLVVPVILGGLLLNPVLLVVELVVALAALIAENVGVGDNLVHPGAYVVFGVSAVIAMLLARDRERLGLSAGRGEQMLFELRDRLRQQGDLPPLPGAWHAETVLEWAGGASFGGDFLVSMTTERGRGIELVIVDVSGKGVDAGNRALMLSGALGGLLGAVPPSQFLHAANAYLLRQEWAEGFATAMHLTIDVTNGKYRLSNAGHLPAVHYRGGTGRWEVVEPAGTVLGVLRDAEFGFEEGVLGPHDALLLYTDGVVEIPGRDIAVGIDKLLGAAERLLSRGFSGGAQRLIDDVAPQATDDRALLLLWRD
jgi:hypothetical protein